MGSSCTRTAYCWEPKTWTWATPLTIEIRWASWVSAYSATVERGRVGELRARKRIGWSAGLTLRYEGGVGIPGGSCRCASEIAA